MFRLSRFGANNDRPGASLAGHLSDLFLGDLPVLRLVRAEKLVERPHPPIVVGLSPKRIIHPATEAFRSAFCYRRASSRQEPGLDGRRQPLPIGHTNMLLKSHGCRTRVVRQAVLPEDP